MESLSTWSLAGVVVLSVITAIRLSTQRVSHTFNYDITVSNGVNLCSPGAYGKAGNRNEMETGNGNWKPETENINGNTTSSLVLARFNCCYPIASLIPRPS